MSVFAALLPTTSGTAYAWIWTLPSEDSTRRIATGTLDFRPKRLVIVASKRRTSARLVKETAWLVRITPSPRSNSHLKSIIRRVTGLP